MYLYVNLWARAKKYFQIKKCSKIRICQNLIHLLPSYRFFTKHTYIYMQPLPYRKSTEVGKTFFLGILKIITFLTKFRISFVFLNILFTFVQNFENLKRYDESKPNLIRPNQADDIQVI